MMYLRLRVFDSVLVIVVQEVESVWMWSGGQMFLLEGKKVVS